MVKNENNYKECVLKTSYKNNYMFLKYSIFSLFLRCFHTHPQSILTSLILLKIKYPNH